MPPGVTTGRPVPHLSASGGSSSSGASVLGKSSPPMTPSRRSGPLGLSSTCSRNGTVSRKGAQWGQQQVQKPRGQAEPRPERGGPRTDRQAWPPEITPPALRARTRVRGREDEDSQRSACSHFATDVHRAVLRLPGHISRTTPNRSSAATTPPSRQPSFAGWIPRLARGGSLFLFSWLRSQLDIS